MEKASAKKTSLKKTLSGAAAGILAALSLTVGPLFDAPAELLAMDNAPDAEERGFAASAGKRPAARQALPQRPLGARLRRFFLARPAPVKGLALLPLWCMGKALLGLISLLASALAPVWQAALSLLLNAGLLIALFALVYKLLFPNSSLRALLRGKRLFWLMAGGFLLSLADWLARRFFEPYRPVSIALRIAFALLTLALLSRAVFGRRKGAAAA